MNYLLLLPSERKANGDILVSDSRLEYLRDFHTLKKGNEYKSVLLGVGAGSLTLASLESNQAVFQGEILPATSEYFPCSLIVGLSRPQTIKKVLQYAAMFRIKKISFVPSELGEKSYLSSKVLQPENLQYELIKGLDQVGSPWMPEVKVLDRFSALKNEIQEKQLCLLAEPDATVGLDNIVSDLRHAKNIALAIGSENGWSDNERKSFKKLGFGEFALSSDHLRVEVALAAILGAFSATVNFN